jgi:hypothetical protein
MPPKPMPLIFIVMVLSSLLAGFAMPMMKTSARLKGVLVKKRKFVHPDQGFPITCIGRCVQEL